MLKMLEGLTRASKYRMKFVNVWKFADDSPSLHRKIVREVQEALGITGLESYDYESTEETGATGSGFWNLAFFTKAQKWEVKFGFLTIIAILITLVCAYAAVALRHTFPLLSV